MYKEPKRNSLWQRPGWKLFLAVESGFIVIAYYYYYKMNRKREFRYDMYRKHRYILEMYYKLGEWGGFKTREEDYKYWGVTDDKSSSSR